MEEHTHIARNDPQATLEWLSGNPDLKELQVRFPDVWREVEEELATRFQSGASAGVRQYLQRLAQQVQPSRAGRGTRQERQVRDHVRYRMATIAVRRHYVSVASGVESGTIRFNLLNGFMAQKLLFRDGLERKPVSFFWFRLIWPMVWQKRLLMPLVQPEGIYCFYTRELVQSLVKMIGGRNCLEIAAGDGTLTRFLVQAGVSATASDDYSWEHAIRYPELVRRQEAREALRQHNPQVVICSWPPADNDFESQVFRTKSVQLYIVISSSHRHAAGDWSAYRDQTAFEMEVSPDLGRLVLPPELDPMVYVFRRKEEES